MDNNFDIPISIEKFAAYLDGNLPQYEIDDIDAIIGAIKATHKANRATAKTEILPLMPNYSNRYKPTPATR